MRTRLRVVLLSIAALVAVQASAGISPEHPILTSRGSFLNTFGITGAFDGTSYVLVYDDNGRLVVRHVDESGNAGEPIVLYDAAVNARVAAANGVSLAVWLAPAGSQRWNLNVAWIPATGTDVRHAQLLSDLPGGGIAVAAVGDHFLVAWNGDDGVHTARLDPYATAISIENKVTDEGDLADLVASNGQIIISWQIQKPIDRACPLGTCFQSPRPHLQFLTADGALASDDLGWPTASLEPLPADASELISLDSAGVIHRSGDLLERWEIPEAWSTAIARGQVYAVRKRSLHEGALMTTFGPVGSDARLAREYILAGTPFVPNVEAQLTAGSKTLLAWYWANSAGLEIHIGYRTINLDTPFPPLPPAPATFFVEVGQSDSKTFPGLYKARLSWSPVFGVTRYIVEAEPLSDPRAIYFPATIPPDMTSASLDPIDSGVLYAFRVYAASDEALSLPARVVERTPTNNFPRIPAEFSYSLSGNNVTFRWLDTSTSETGFTVFACTRSHTCRSIATVPPNTTTVTTTLLPGSWGYSLGAAAGNGLFNYAPEVFYFTVRTRTRAVRH